MCVQVIGGGALGTMVAARFARAGIDTRLIVRDGSLKHSIAQRSAGIARIVIEGEDAVQVKVTTQTEGVGSRFVLCTKAYDAKAAVSRLCTPGAKVVALCNGTLALRSKLNELNVNLIAATTTHGCWERAPFEIVHAGFGRVWISIDDVGGHEFVDDFECAGLGAVPLSKEQMDDRLWSKLAANCVLNPITALLECNNGSALPRAEPLAKRVCTEIATLRHFSSSRSKKTCQISDYADQLYEDVADCARENANNFSSMFQDLRHSRPTEIEFLNEWVVSASEQMNPILSTPANRRLVAAIRDRASFPSDPGHLLKALLVDR